MIKACIETEVRYHCCSVTDFFVLQLPIIPRKGGQGALTALELFNW